MVTKKQRLHKLRKRAMLKVVGNNGTARPVFVVGTQRSGTNMFARVLDRSLQTECYHENDEEAFDNYVLRDHHTIARLVQRSSAEVVVFKPICDSQHTKQLLALHPGSQAVWVYREYPDVVNSSLKMFKANYRDNYLHNMLFEPDRAAWRIENVVPRDLKLVEKFYRKGVSDASARALIWYLRNALFFQQGLESDSRVLLANYERLVTQPAERFQRVFDFLGLTYKDRLVDSVFSSSVSKAANPEIDPEIQSLCDEMYNRLELVLQKGEP